MIADFGEQVPFVNIRDAEARHVDALAALLERHGLPSPGNSWPGKVERFAAAPAG